MKKNKSTNLVEFSLEDLKKQIETSSRIIFPSDKYQTDPVAFCKEILGFEPWEKQVEILQAVINYDRVAVKSGHKVGKSRTAIIIALWFYCSFPEARVIMTSTTAHQVKNILWRELTMVMQKAINPIDGTLSPLPSSGLKSFDHREIIGFTAREPEAVAGFSGNLLYILDEASGIPDDIHKAIEGNRASGNVRSVMFSNPTRLTGTFFDAFNKNRKLWHTITISSEESPNVVHNKEVIPYLAGPKWIEEKKIEWGEDSPIYAVRVKGEFPNQDDLTVVPIYAVDDAIQRSKDEELQLHCPDYLGPWFIGLDPAGQGSDESVICFRRNFRVVKMIAKNGLDANQILEVFHTEYYKLTNGQPAAPGQLPTVVIDNTGGFGSGIIPNLDKRKFNVIPVHFAAKAFNPEYFNIRSEMWFNITTWLKAGPAILPEDDKLAYELTSVKYFLTGKGQRQIEDKDQIKKILKHSPDRADALALSLYNYKPYFLPKQNIIVPQAVKNKMPKTINKGIINPYQGIITPFKQPNTIRQYR